MGCSTCANNNDGTPKGCKNNGSCGTSGCNKLEVFDWLSNMVLPEGQLPFDAVEVRFKNSRKEFFRNVKNFPLGMGDVVTLEGAPGFDVGVVSATGELVKLQMSKHGVKTDSYELKKVMRKSTEQDVAIWQEARGFEKETMLKAREIAKELELVMKISDVEFQGDKSKATFFYTADERVDFRDLIRQLADKFKVRVEMRQIGSRQEAARLGGIGSCGRELCCTTWLTDFRTVSTSAARYQQLSLNPQKLAGQCGKLKCCLNYELDMYVEALKSFPDQNTIIKTKKGTAKHFKTDIFKGTVWYLAEGESGPIPVLAEKALELIEKNKKGEMPGSLRDYEIVIEEVKEEVQYENVVGQDSLTRFDKPKKSKGKNNNNKNKNRRKPEGITAAPNVAKKPEAKGENKNKPAAQKKEGEAGAKPRPNKNANRNRNNKNKPKTDTDA